MAKNQLSYTVLKDIGFSLLEEGRTIKIRADGLSMYPTIKQGSVIFIGPYEKDSHPLPGEIIAFKKDAGFIVHRLVRLYDEGNNILVVTRGDSSIKDDEPVPVEMVAGKVVRIEDPSGRTIPFRPVPGKKPKYVLNRFLVKIILLIYRIKKFFGFSLQKP
jgi:signal peptidase I